MIVNIKTCSAGTNSEAVCSWFLSQHDACVWLRPLSPPTLLWFSERSVSHDFDLVSETESELIQIFLWAAHQ